MKIAREPLICRHHLDFPCRMQVGFAFLLLLRVIHPASAQSSDTQTLVAFAQKLTNPSSNRDTQNPCSWKGVSCTSGNRVQGLNMSSAQLNGTISPIIAGLSRLTYVNLSNNQLTGNIPAGLIFVSELKILDLSTNFLSGFIPPICTSYFSKLTELYLNDNQLSGKLGSSLANCQQLLVLSLANNQLVDQDLLINLSNLPTLRTVSLSGNTIGAAIPPVIKTWKNMKGLLLEGCSLTDYFPKEIASLRNMETLNVKNNRLIGRLPDELFDCISLKNLYLDGNKFTGPIPSLIGDLSDLQIFYGNDNRFTDAVPESIFSLIQMRGLNLCNNTFHGTLSGKVGDLKHLYSLDLSQNLITGQIPEEISGCESLSWLDLSSNQMSDTIPSSVGNLTLLNYLNLSHNRLTGQIPSSFANLSSLQLFDVSYNQLVGLVPDTDGLRQFPMSSFEYNKGLCGWITNQSVQQCLPRSYFKHLSSHIAIIVVIVIFLLLGVGAWQYLVRWSPLQPVVARPQMTFTVRDLLDATEGFSQRNFIGEGLHYRVYKGLLAGNKAVAVKHLKQECVEEFHHVFTVDWRTLSKAKNPYLVDVLGWCASTEMLAVVTAFMPNGTLDQQLHSKDAAISMPWDRRVQIANGVAHGLAFLHGECQGRPLLRCELQSTSILLDEQFEPHLLDVRVAKSRNEFLEGQTIVSDGYTAPECTSGTMVTASAEVYSYGIVLLELLTRKKPVNFFLWSGLSIAEAFSQSFPAWDIVDPLLHAQSHREQVLRLMEVALCCINAMPESRPSMETVLLMLKEVVYDSSTTAVDFYTYQQPIQDSHGDGVVIEGSAGSHECPGDMCQNPLFQDYSYQSSFDRNDVQERNVLEETNYNQYCYEGASTFCPDTHYQDFEDTNE